MISTFKQSMYFLRYNKSAVYMRIQRFFIMEIA